MLRAMIERLKIYGNSMGSIIHPTNTCYTQVVVQASCDTRKKNKNLLTIICICNV